MARNREFLNATPPQSSDEEDDDDTSSEGISDTDSDASIKTPVKTQPPKEGEEEDDDESGSETDSGSDSDSPAKPLAAKQLVEEARIVSRSKTISPESAAATPVQSVSVATKRPAEHSSASKEPKKMKAGDAEAEASEKKSFMMKIGEAESSEKKSVTKKADEAESSEKQSVLFPRLWSEDGEESSAAKRERDLMNGKGEEKLAGGGSGLGSLSVGRTTDEVMMMTGQEQIGGTKEWDLLREQEIEAVINQLKVRVRQYEQVLSYMRSKRSNGSG